MTYSTAIQYRNRPNNKSSMYGLLGTICACVLIFLFMILYIFPHSPVIPPVQEEGLMISFGYNNDGGGAGDETPKSTPVATSETQTVTQPIQQVTSKTVTATQPEKTVDRDYITQSEPSLAIAEKNKKVKEAQKADMERIAADKKATEQKKREQEAINRAAQSMNGVFGSPNGTATTAGNGTGTGTGGGAGSGSQGNPAGKGYIGGNSWSLAGRSLSGRLVSPSYDKDVEGKVTVNIRVDRTGAVTSTTIGSPTTISDKATINAAMTAARNTRFSTSNGDSSGSITYNFKLK